MLNLNLIKDFQASWKIFMKNKRSVKPINKNI